MQFVHLEDGIFRERPNRFGAVIVSGGRTVYVHVPNSGRLTELLVPGRPVKWRPADNSRTDRRTAGDLVLVRGPRGWVCIDARLPPLLLAEYLAGRRVAPFGRCTAVSFEPALGAGRADLIIECPQSTWIIETKSVTLARGGAAMFPDAPTQRGRRHMHELAALARRSGARPAVVFVAQRADVYFFQPNDRTDPHFGRALRGAAQAGVAVAAFKCRVGVRGIRIASPIPVRL